MNVCIFMGRIGSDPEIRETQGGVKKCAFRLAVQRRFKDANGERQADFIQCIAWRQTAEFIHNYIHKGDMVGVKGSLQNRSYQAQDGQPVMCLKSSWTKSRLAEAPRESRCRNLPRVKDICR